MVEIHGSILTLSFMEYAYYSELKTPKLFGDIIDATEIDSLKTTLEKYIEQSDKRIDMIKQSFELLNRRPYETKCDVTDGLIEQVVDLLETFPLGVIRDAGLVTSLQTMSCIKVTRYKALISWVTLAKQNEVVPNLQIIVKEEIKLQKNLLRTLRNDVADFMF